MITSNYHLSPYKSITILLTIFPVLYIISLWLIFCFFKKDLFIFGCTGSSLLCGLLFSLVAVSGATLVSVCGLLIAVASLVAEHSLKAPGACLVAPLHVGSHTRDLTHVPWIGRGILNHWVTREAHSLITGSLCFIISFTWFAFPPFLQPCLFPVFMSHFIFVFRYYVFYCIYIGWAKKLMQVFLS